MKLKPRGELCVAPDRTTGEWAVIVCDGTGIFQRLQTFHSHDDALHFANEESARRHLATGIPVSIHLPQDCPCYCNITTRM